MKNKYSGFTLIELMIVVAIIGVIAATSLPLYLNYVMKTQVHRAVAELSGYRSSFESQVHNSSTVTNSDLGYVVSDITSGSSATDIGTLNPDGSGHIEVTMGDKAYSRLSGTVLRFERSSAGSWQCVIDPSAAAGWKDEFVPSSCTVI